MKAKRTFPPTIVGRQPRRTCETSQKKDRDAIDAAFKAPDVPERLVVGQERAFLTWFYDRAMVNRDVITSADVDETLRTFAGREGVLGAMGVYRTAFTSIQQTEPLAGLLTGHKVKVPVVALGGVKGLGDKVLTTIKLVAKDAEGEVVPDCGHFLPEERPDVVLRHIHTLVERSVEP